MSVSFPLWFLERLRRAHHVVALTGAGISAESGVPTFREAQTGLWARYDPTELATPEAFLRDPALVWRWYAWRRGLIAQASPNPGHRALAGFEDVFPKVTVLTQNVDGLHTQAGSTRVVELHGNIHRNLCFREGAPVPPGAERPGEPPTCPRCGDYVRPGVVWFGEMLPTAVLQAAHQAAAECEVFFSIGTSSVVEPAASLPLFARDKGALVVEINPAATPLTPHADLSLRGPAGHILPALLAALTTP